MYVCTYTVNIFTYVRVYIYSIYIFIYLCTCVHIQYIYIYLCTVFIYSINIYLCTYVHIQYTFTYVRVYIHSIHPRGFAETINLTKFKLLFDWPKRMTFSLCSDPLDHSLEVKNRFDNISEHSATNIGRAGKDSLQ